MTNEAEALRRHFHPKHTTCKVAQGVHQGVYTLWCPRTLAMVMLTFFSIFRAYHIELMMMYG